MKSLSNSSAILGNHQFITDGGLETTLVYEYGYDLPEFAAFPLLEQQEGKEVLREYFLRYLELAGKNNCGFLLESPTWRASSGWGQKIGYSPKELESLNIKAIEFLAELRRTFPGPAIPMIISGCLGPRGDGYHIDSKMTPEEAKAYHFDQIKTFSGTEADLVSAYTINYSEEAIGITLAAREAGIPAVISFTLETDGRLPSGQPLRSAIQEVDGRTGTGPLYYMINCAHPTHFKHILTGNDAWLKRIKAVRANASSRSHAELDEATELDQGDPREFGLEYGDLKQLLPNLTIFGGCCGTDHHHVEEICREVLVH